MFNQNIKIPNFDEFCPNMVFMTSKYDIKKVKTENSNTIVKFYDL